MKPVNNRIFCIGCKRPKMLFETQAKADNFIKFNSEEIALQSKKAPTRSYYCSFCCGWHVTSVSEEERGKQNDERDEKLWETIRSTSKAKKKIKEKKSKTSLIVNTPKKRKFPCSTEGFQLRFIAQKIDKTLNKVESDLFSAKINSLSDNFNHLLKLEKELRSKSNEFNIYVTRIDKRYEKIENFKNLFLDVYDYFIYEDLRKKYLADLPDSELPQKKNIIINNIEIIYEIKRCFENIESLSHESAGEEIKNQCNKIINDLIPQLKGSTAKLKKEFKQEALNILTSLPSSNPNVDLYYRDLILAIIDHLEKAHEAYIVGDIGSCVYYLQLADSLMPGNDNEVENALSHQIANLKSSLNLAE